MTAAKTAHVWHVTFGEYMRSILLQVYTFGDGIEYVAVFSAVCLVQVSAGIYFHSISFILAAQSIRMCGSSKTRVPLGRSTRR